MKRCCNCGWFNHDSARCCEKCEDTSFEVEDEPVESVPEADPIIEVISETPETQVKNPMAATLAFSSSRSSVQPAADSVTPEGPMSCPKCCYPVSGEVDYCPSCGATIKKPVPQGTRSESSIGKETVKCALSEEVAQTVVETIEPESKSLAQTVSFDSNKKVAGFRQASTGLKATVADVSALIPSVDDDSDCCRLVPVDALGDAEIVLRSGEIVVIHGKKYRFEKC